MHWLAFPKYTSFSLHPCQLLRASDFLVFTDVIGKMEPLNFNLLITNMMCVCIYRYPSMNCQWILSLFCNFSSSLIFQSPLCILITDPNPLNITIIFSLSVSFLSYLPLNKKAFILMNASVILLQFVLCESYLTNPSLP